MTAGTGLCVVVGRGGWQASAQVRRGVVVVLRTHVAWPSHAVRARAHAGAGSGGVGAAGAQGMGGRALIYGATDILQGQELLAQLAELGRRCGVGPGGIERAPAGAAGF